MPDIGGSATDAFGAGVNHQVNTGRGNDNSVTLGGSLQADGDRWDAESMAAATSPHSVLAPYAFSQNASANGSDGGHFIPGYGSTGSANGLAGADYEKNMLLKMQGDGTNDLP